MKRFKNSQNIFRLCSYIFFIVICLALISPLFLRLEPERITKVQPKQDNRKIRIDSTNLKIQDSCLIQSNALVWEDYHNRSFEGRFEVCERDYTRATQNRVTTPPADYMKLVRFDAPNMNRIYKLFYDTAQENNLDYTETAEMIVSCIQHIPYTLVIPNSTEQFMVYLTMTHQQDTFMYQYIQDGKPVLDNIQTFGVQSPVEFSYNLKGDCDTRTTWLYTVLSKFHYDVVILNSDIKGHSILGINLPYANGNTFYLDRRTGKKYYVWETTAVGYPIGVFPNFKANEWYVATASTNNL